MPINDANTDAHGVPAVWAEEYERARDYTGLLAEFLAEHPSYADENGFYADGPFLRSPVLEAKLPATPEDMVESEQGAHMLFAYIQGMQTILSRLDDKLPCEMDDPDLADVAIEEQLSQGASED